MFPANTRTSKAVAKYLRIHAEPETELLQQLTTKGPFEAVVVIPVFDETSDFARRLIDQFFVRLRLLAIIVVNRPDSIPGCDRNLRLLRDLQELAASGHQRNCENLTLLSFGQSALLLVDRERRPVPARQGVGLARKLGSDLACRLMHDGAIHSRWIHCSDADALLPADYFTATQALNQQVIAGYHRFTHLHDGSDIAEATRYYEQHLRHYRHGLLEAGSPYAFFSIGSTLVFDYCAYAAAHGFPKRAGGEDFYLLNKLAKLGQVTELQSCVRLQPRLSTRVPFGTGPACHRILESLKQEEPVCSYDPEIFVLLRTWLQRAQQLIDSSRGQPLHFDNETLAGLHPALVSGLGQLGLEHCERHLNRSTSRDWRRRHLHNWFDGFRTLRLIHYLERNGFPPRPLKFSRFD